MMYDLSTIHRLNDEAALRETSLRETFPEHDCLDTATDQDGFWDLYMRVEDDSTGSRDEAVRIARDLLDTLYPLDSIDAAGLFERRDFEVRLDYLT